MKRRFLIAIPLLLSLPYPAQAQTDPRAAPLSPADQGAIARLEAYLNGIHTLHARFLQVAPDNRTSQGEAWLQRPGEMRFQYDSPAPYLLVANGGRVVFQDKQLDQVSTIPLTSTPLGLLLRDPVRLSGDVTVTDLQRLPGQIQLTAVRSAKPEDGSLTLIFATDPLTLRSWRILDAQHQETRVSLFDVQLGGRFDPNLFVFKDTEAEGDQR